MNQEIVTLFKNYLDDRCSQEEILKVLSIIADGKYQEELEFVLTEDALQISKISETITSVAQNNSDALHSRITQSIQEPKNKTVKLKKWISLSAAAIILIVVGGILFYPRHKTAILKGEAEASIVVPAQSGATLTLASGKTINLTTINKGQLLAEAGVKVEKTNNGEVIYHAVEDVSKPEIHTLSTAKGETYQLNLSDGTKVWLNASSSLTYNSVLNHEGKRKVKLIGEAYFEVAKDSKHPFLVITNNQEVQVLGTHFNINSYNFTKQTTTTLLEGAVKVTSPTSAMNLLPGEQTVFKAGQLKVRQADIEKVMGWKNHLFVFRNDELTDILENIAIWYNINVQYTDDIKGIKYWGAISNKNKLSDILKYLSKAGQVHFEFDQQNLKVFKN